MYVLYLSQKLHRKDYGKLCTKFASFLKRYKISNDLEKGESRILLDQKFKAEVEKHFKVHA